MSSYLLHSHKVTEASPSPELIATAAIISQRSELCCRHFTKGLSSKVMDACYHHDDDVNLLAITLMHRNQGHTRCMHTSMSYIQYAVTTLTLFGHKTASYLQITRELNSFPPILKHKRLSDYNQCD